MKYRFITVMHNMSLATTKNKGIKIIPGFRLSNGEQILKETIGTQLLKETAGWHSTNEFENSTYAYCDREFSDMDDTEENHKKQSNYNFYCLRELQHYIHTLWEVKDNSVYVRDGFLIVYDKNINDGRTYKASVSAIYSMATTEKKKVQFCDDELRDATKRFETIDISQITEIEDDYKNVSDTHFYKKKSNRLMRAYYFAVSARANGTLPMKIVSYCNALECLFTVQKTELNHKIAERVAYYIGDSIEEKKKLYKVVKKAYDIRSTIVHGSSIKDSMSEALLSLSIELDEIMRIISKDESDTFLKNDNDLEDFFVDLLFGKRTEQLDS